MLFRENTILGIHNFNIKCTKSRVYDRANPSFNQVYKISDKIFPGRRLDHWRTVENKDLVIQRVDKGNNIIIFNRSDYISKLSKILQDTSTFKKVNIEEAKALNQLVRMVKRTKRLLKSSEDQGAFSEK